MLYNLDVNHEGSVTQKAPCSFLYNPPIINQIDNSSSLINCGIATSNKIAVQKPSIQIAFDRGLWNWVWFLLRHGAPFPIGLKIKLIPRHHSELLEFVRMSEKCTEILKKSPVAEIIAALENRVITASFRSLDNQSAVSIAFHAKRYDLFVLLKSKGFDQFSDETFLEINRLSKEDQLEIKNLMMIESKFEMFRRRI